MAWKLPLALTTAASAAIVTAATAFGASPGVDPTVPAKHDADPIILTGAQFPDWSARSNVTAKLPLTDLETCSGSVDVTKLSDPNNAIQQDTNCDHNHYAQPEVDTGNTLGDGTPTNELLGYRWNARAKKFVQIPFQVDEMFTRYLDNSASGFAIYSGEDQHTTYAFDREGFRYTKEDPANPCHALPDSPPAPDPVKGLDDNDELVFMASDAGPQAPAGAALPKGIAGAREIRIDDPTNPSAQPSYAYVMKADPNGPKPAFNADNGYVRYARDDSADTFVYSQSSYDNYGNATRGHFEWDGQCVGAPDTKDNQERCANAPSTPPDGITPNDPPITDPSDPRSAFFLCPQRHRPADGATISTDRYKFRYDGRWLLTGLQISATDDGQNYGPDLIDRWKARAFAQDPYSETPCCGYEDEDKNWGGSSTLLGEKVGPVRAIRETWGADSGTNVIRRETFYRDQIRQKTFLRVHVIPPADGIYAQWDFNAGKVTRYYNPRVPDGVPVDGRNDETLGNFDDPCNSDWNSMPGRSQIDQAYRDMYQKLSFCSPPCDPAFGSGQCLPLNRYHLSMDVTDPTFNTVNASLDWNEVAGKYGTVVDRYQLDKVTDATPGGLPQELLAVPYYRDDSCFDDGTGSDPGPRLIPRSDAEPRTYTDATGTHPRQCWTPADGDPAGSPKYFQGDIGTHGLHLLMIAESDNARQTVPVDEIVSEQRIVLLPGNKGNVGEQYGRSFEKPLVANALPYNGTAAAPNGKAKGGSNGGSADGSAYATPPAHVRKPRRVRGAVPFGGRSIRVTTVNGRITAQPRR